MASRNPDEIRVTLMVDLVVSERNWRRLMEEHGRDLTGIVIPAHVQRVGKTIVKREFERLGFPQPHIREQ